MTKTHCKRGHEFATAGTHWKRDGKTRIVCRECQRLRSQQRRDRGATHCPQGHERTPENTLTYKRGDGRTQNKCRACGREAQQQRRSQQRSNRMRPARMPDHCPRGHELNERTVYVSQPADGHPAQWECCLCLREDLYRAHYRLPRTEPVPPQILDQVGAVQTRASMATEYTGDQAPEGCHSTGETQNKSATSGVSLCA